VILFKNFLQENLKHIEKTPLAMESIFFTITILSIVFKLEKSFFLIVFVLGVFLACFLDLFILFTSINDHGPFNKSLYLENLQKNKLGEVSFVGSLLLCILMHSYFFSIATFFVWILFSIFDKTFKKRSFCSFSVFCVLILYYFVRKLLIFLSLIFFIGLYFIGFRKKTENTFL